MSLVTSGSVIISQEHFEEKEDFVTLCHLLYSVYAFIHTNFFTTITIHLNPYHMPKEFNERCQEFQNVVKVMFVRSVIIQENRLKQSLLISPIKEGDNSNSNSPQKTPSKHISKSPSKFPSRSLSKESLSQGNAAKEKQRFSFLNPEITEIPKGVYFGHNSKLIEQVHSAELSRLKNALEKNSFYNLYLEALAYKLTLTPEGPKLTMNKLAENLEKKFAYLKEFTSVRQLSLLRSSKDVGKVYYLIRIFTMDRPRTLTLPSKDLFDTFRSLLYTYEMQGFIPTSSTQKILTWHLLTNQILLFGSHFVFPQQKYSHTSIYTLNSMVVDLVSSDQTPEEIHTLLMHNCVNVLHECSESSKDAQYKFHMLERIEEAVEKRGGWERVELGVRKIWRFLESGRIEY